MISLDDVRAAAQRIAPYVRRTPLLAADQIKSSITKGELSLKLECLQVSGSFKARGAANRVMSLPSEQRARGLVAASGGNHGLAVARCGHIAKVPVTIFLPESVAPEKVVKMQAWGANTVVGGDDFDHCNALAHVMAEKEKATYVHPFADPFVVAGQGTVALEIFEDRPETETVIIAAGGGGFVTGAGTAIKALNPNVKVVVVEPYGSPTLYNSAAAGEVVTLPRITSAIPTMSCRRTDEALFAQFRTVVDEYVLIEDAHMAEAAQWLWFEMGIAADPAGAAAVAALLSGAYKADRGEKITVAVCGAGLPQ
ncbi:pyridoxal-phosphate dependent enzyme [Falsochrobactrum sp. TDYN1]|uniref:Pyridoxal-phosphate dependent enzyme n=1 Tax=Falsochrobactrum tianjinense TaxID=2706015 RepID=A0A949PM13_9HYPH|nr:pyridoxal-phosphate dependent enzyme [Falsochrobactrum sp. TDYN1]MBV2143543.1 pyridoxal-phosphate dependent enzyme [Falsochrobactrum sp. TDYN1]